MTRDEALYNIKQGYGIPHKHDTLTTIIEYVKKTEPCEDAISRQWIKTAIHNFYDGLMHTPTEEDIQAYLSAAPSVQPKAKAKEPRIVVYSGDGYADGNIVYDFAECPNCGYEYEDGDKDWKEPFCPHCGQALKWEVEE